MSSRDQSRGCKIGYVYTKKSSKPITQIALDGEFTYSQACVDDSTDSRVTMLPSIAITQASPSSKRREDAVVRRKADADTRPTGNRSNVQNMFTTASSGDCRSIPQVSGVQASASRQATQADHLMTKSPVRSDAESGLLSVREKSSSSSSDNKFTTMYFSGDDARLSFKGILIPKLSDNFGDTHLEAAYQKYSHRQRQKSLLILNLIDAALKVAFFLAFLMRMREMSGRIRIPVADLLYILPWIIGNGIVIGLISCWNKCANHYLHLAALLTILLFTMEAYLVFGVAAPASMTASSPESVWYMIFVMFSIYSMMPLPLTWCVACGSASCLLDLIVMIVSASTKDDSFFMKVNTVLLSECLCDEFVIGSWMTHGNIDPFALASKA